MSHRRDFAVNGGGHLFGVTHGVGGVSRRASAVGGVGDVIEALKSGADDFQILGVARNMTHQNEKAAFYGVFSDVGGKQALSQQRGEVRRRRARRAKSFVIGIIINK